MHLHHRKATMTTAMPTLAMATATTTITTTVYTALFENVDGCWGGCTLSTTKAIA